MVLLKALAIKYALARRGEDKPSTSRRQLATRAASDQTTIGQMLGALRQVAKDQPRQFPYSVARVLSQGGGPATLAALQTEPWRILPWRAGQRDEVMADIRRRTRPQAPRTQPARRGAARPKPPAPAEAELAKLRKALSEGMSSRNFGQALTVLTVHDPSAVVKFLLGWTEPKRSWRDKGAGYGLGSYFAHRCGKDRRKHLTALLEAKDPYVRVAGARALDVFRTRADGGMAGVPHGNLQKRLTVLLSNTARHSGLPQPDLGTRRDANPHQLLTAWWNKYKDKAILHDPWLGVLDKQKVD